MWDGNVMGVGNEMNGVEIVSDVVYERVFPTPLLKIAEGSPPKKNIIAAMIKVPNPPPTSIPPPPEPLLSSTLSALSFVHFIILKF